jgi:hypothetical protein
MRMGTASRRYRKCRRFATWTGTASRRGNRIAKRRTAIGQRSSELAMCQKTGHRRTWNRVNANPVVTGRGWMRENPPPSGHSGRPGPNRPRLLRQINRVLPMVERRRRQGPRRHRVSRRLPRQIRWPLRSSQLPQLRLKAPPRLLHQRPRLLHQRPRLLHQSRRNRKQRLQPSPRLNQLLLQNRAVRLTILGKSGAGNGSRRCASRASVNSNNKERGESVDAEDPGFQLQVHGEALRYVCLDLVRHR